MRSVGLAADSMLLDQNLERNLLTFSCDCTEDEENPACHGTVRLPHELLPAGCCPPAAVPQMAGLNCWRYSRLAMPLARTAGDEPLRLAAVAPCDRRSAAPATCWLHTATPAPTSTPTHRNTTNGAVVVAVVVVVVVVVVVAAAAAGGGGVVVVEEVVVVAVVAVVVVVVAAAAAAAVVGVAVAAEVVVIASRTRTRSRSV